jgi:hypothetical protein
MRTVLILMLLTLSAFAQQEAPAGATACGAKDVKYDAKLDEFQHMLAPPKRGRRWFTSSKIWAW